MANRLKMALIDAILSLKARAGRTGGSAANWAWTGRPGDPRQTAPAICQRWEAYVQIVRDLGVGLALGTGQDNARPRRQALGAFRPACPLLKGLAFVVGQDQGLLGSPGLHGELQL